MNCYRQHVQTLVNIMRRGWLIAWKHSRVNQTRPTFLGTIYAYSHVIQWGLPITRILEVCGWDPRSQSKELDWMRRLQAEAAALYKQGTRLKLRQPYVPGTTKRGSQEHRLGDSELTSCRC